MRFNKLLAVVPFVFVALVGCKPSCEGLCDNAADEDCDNFDHDSCMYNCIVIEDLQKDTDKCDDDFDALTSCINDQDDICKAFEVDADTLKYKKCNSEYEDLAKCYSDYCDDHDKRDYCS